MQSESFKPKSQKIFCLEVTGYGCEEERATQLQVSLDLSCLHVLIQPRTILFCAACILFTSLRSTFKKQGRGRVLN